MGVNVCKAFDIEDIDRAAAGMRLPCFDLLQFAALSDTSSVTSLVCWIFMSCTACFMGINLLWKSY